MLVKEVLTFFLLLVSLQINGEDNLHKLNDFSWQSTEILENQDSKNGQKKHFEKNKKWHGKKFKEREIEAPLLFENVYKHWDENKHKKYNSAEHKERENYMSINEVDSNSYIDNYNKYENTLKPNRNEISKKYKNSYHDKSVLEIENYINNNKKISDDNKLITEDNKSVSLMHDTNVNYINNNKKVSDDSELLTEDNKSVSLKEDTNVNYINNDKKISDDSELITEDKSVNLKQDVNVNYINNDKKLSDVSELLTEDNKSVNLKHDVNVNYINSNKKISDDSELKSKDIYNDQDGENYENFLNKDKIYLTIDTKDIYENLKRIDLRYPPPPNNTILMARYIVHAVDWAAIGTISGRSPTKNDPFVCVKATSDGLENTSTGIPYFYLSKKDLCTQDILRDSRASVLVTLSETDYCKQQKLDPQDPRCAKVTLSGKIKKVKPNSTEEKFARDALFFKHPAMVNWPLDHNWFIAKLKIGQIVLLDQFGGATYIKVKNYLKGGEKS